MRLWILGLALWTTGCADGVKIGGSPEQRWLAAAQAGSAEGGLAAAAHAETKDLGSPSPVLTLGNGLGATRTDLLSKLDTLLSAAPSANASAKSDTSSIAQALTAGLAKTNDQYEKLITQYTAEQQRDAKPGDLHWTTLQKSITALKEKQLTATESAQKEIAAITGDTKTALSSAKTPETTSQTGLAGGAGAAGSTESAKSAGAGGSEKAKTEAVKTETVKTESSKSETPKTETAKTETVAKVEPSVSCDKANQRVGELTRDVDRANADVAAAQTAGDAADKELAAATKALLEAPPASTADQVKALQEAVEKATKAIGAARIDKPAKAALLAALVQALSEAKKVADLACKKP